MLTMWLRNVLTIRESLVWDRRFGWFLLVVDSVSLRESTCNIAVCIATSSPSSPGYYAPPLSTPFFPFVGDDVVAKCRPISNIKNKAVLDSKRRKFRPKCVRMRLAAGLCPDPLGELERSPNPLAAIGGGVPTSTGKGREGNG